MKKVVNTDENTISLSNITDSSIIGIHTRAGSKVFTVPTKTEFQNVNITLLTLSDRTYNSKKELVKKNINAGHRVYVFDTTRELRKWLVE